MEENCDAYCCLCQKIPDPEIPPDKFKIDPDARRVIPPEGIAPVMNPYDERAVELALRLKEKYGGKITALTLGSAISVSSGEACSVNGGR